MDAPEGAAGKAGARKRPAADEVKRGDGPVAPKNLALSLDARDRLGVHALKTGRTEGEIVDWLVCAHLRRYVISDRGGAAALDPADRASGAGAVVPIAEALTSSEAETPTPESGQGRGQGPRSRRTA